jgi:hypothetical protein
VQKKDGNERRFALDRDGEQWQTKPDSGVRRTGGANPARAGDDWYINNQAFDKGDAIIYAEFLGDGELAPSVSNVIPITIK